MLWLATEAKSGVTYILDGRAVSMEFSGGNERTDGEAKRDGRATKRR